mgnify:FL=1
MSAKKAERLYKALQKIRQQKRQAKVDYTRGVGEDKAGELAGQKLMKKSQDKFNRLSVDEEKIVKQLEGYQPELFNRGGSVYGS